MNSSCEAYYAGPGGTNGHGCEQPGTNPAYTVGPEMIYEEKIFWDYLCLRPARSILRPPRNLARVGTNLARPATTAQFCGQDALPGT